MQSKRPYPTDISDEEWAFAAPYLSLMTEHAPQRKYELRAMFNALRSVLGHQAQVRRCERPLFVGNVGRI
ncbi:transposase, partial [Xanthomonas theicola]|uniref:transposase n=1 Tax=Xanthomonas theicola TaxID=56464 RepID=UPI003CCC94E7